ncbi:MAG: type II secretion system protein [Bacilli bacterium]
MTVSNKTGFTLVELLVVIGILGILSAALFPAISNAVMRANMTAVSTRGRDIYVAITGANTEREPLGLGNVWPQKDVSTSGGQTTSNPDISEKPFTTSTDYFKELYDDENIGTENHSPYVAGFDYGKLAGAGVTAHRGKNLVKEHNMWTIAGNVRDEMEDVVPILVTRNFNAETHMFDKVTDSELSNSKTDPSCWDKEWDSPFSTKGMVLVRKGGGTFTVRAKYAVAPVIYNNQTFDTTLGGANKSLVYLKP